MTPRTILILSPDYPYPPDQGCKRDIWSHIEFFHNTGWHVILVLSKPGNPEKININQVSFPININYHFIPRNPHWSYSENSDTISSMQSLINFYQPQIVWCEYAHFSSLVNLLNIHNAKLWFRSHNFELAHAFEKILAERPWKRWFQDRSIKAPLRWTKSKINLLTSIFFKERLMHKIADHIFFISYGDLKAMSKLYSTSKPKDWVLPFIKSEVIPVKNNKSHLDVIYLGVVNSGAIPNQIGAYLLLEKIIPAIEQKIPNTFHFHLVGKGMSQLFGHYASTSVVIHDYVEDLDQFLINIDISCVPVNLGWGCKIKMIEALACGLPTVGACQSFRGVPALKGAYMACRTTQDYVDAFESLKSFDIRQKVALAGRNAYENWKQHGENILKSAVKESL